MTPLTSIVIPYDAASRSAAAFFAGALAGRANTQVVLAGDGDCGVPSRGNVIALTEHTQRGDALKAALERVEGDVTVLQDADEAYSLDAHASLIEPIRSGRADVVVGLRNERPARELALGRLAAWVSDTNVSDPLSGQRAFRTNVLREVSLRTAGVGVDPELLVKIAAQLYRFIEVPVQLHRAAHRPAGEWLEQARTLVRYATTQNDSDNAHEGYNTLARMEGGAPNYNTWLGERFRAHAGQRVLEVGAGIGTITSLLAPGRERVVALEVDDFYVRRLKNRFRDQPNVEPLLSDVALADWEKLKRERFDSIVLSNVLEHIPDDAGAVQRFAQILAGGGKLLVLVPALQWLFGSMDEAVGHYRRYTMQTLRTVLESKRVRHRAHRVDEPAPAFPGGW